MDDYKKIDYQITANDVEKACDTIWKRYAILYYLPCIFCCLQLVIVVAGTIVDYDQKNIPIIIFIVVCVVLSAVLPLALFKRYKTIAIEDFKYLHENEVCDYSVFLMEDYVGFVNKTNNISKKHNRDELKRVLDNDTHIIVFLDNRRILLLPKTEEAKEYFGLKDN